MDNLREESGVQSPVFLVRAGGTWNMDSGHGTLFPRMCFVISLQELIDAQMRVFLRGGEATVTQ